MGWTGMADPVLTFTVLLQACVPGAIQLILIVDYAKAGPRVSETLGRVLLWQHIICPVSMCIFIAYFLSFAGVNKDIDNDLATFPNNTREIEASYSVFPRTPLIDGL